MAYENTDDINEYKTAYENEKQDFQDTSKGILIVCYGVIDAEIQALKDENIAEAIKCRERLNEYLKTLDLASYNELLLYRRRKFNDLSKDDKERANNNSKWRNEIKACCRNDLANDRANAVSHIKEVEKASRQIFAGISHGGETKKNIEAR